MIARTAALGLALALVAGLIGAITGPDGGARAALGFGLFAAALQTWAVALLAPKVGAPWKAFSRRWAAGMAIRLAGVVVFAILVMVDRRLFPPLLSAVGLLGVMVPLLFYEGRLLR